MKNKSLKPLTITFFISGILDTKAAILDVVSVYHGRLVTHHLFLPEMAKPFQEF